MMEVLRQHLVLINKSKCTWSQTEFSYLGHIVSKDGIKVGPRKIQAVANWPQPTNITVIQQFLGLTNFFCKFPFRTTQTFLCH